eukprot:2795605-Pleurochrysis_carterae.AAC.5
MGLSGPPGLGSGGGGGEGDQFEGEGGGGGGRRSEAKAGRAALTKNLESSKLAPMKTACRRSARAQLKQGPSHS